MLSFCRGAVEMAFALSPLTHEVDPAIMLNMLPHNIFFWVMAFLKPNDLRPSQVCICTCTCSLPDEKSFGSWLSSGQATCPSHTKIESFVKKCVN